MLSSTTFLATTDGSFNTTPSPLTQIIVFAVPRSIAISPENIPEKNLFILLMIEMPFFCENHN